MDKDELAGAVSALTDDAARYALFWPAEATCPDLEEALASVERMRAYLKRGPDGSPASTLAEVEAAAERGLCAYEHPGPCDYPGEDLTT
ncbi:MAG TPA: hypothetical protein VNF75_00990 [Candidatus Dormibacteraeota bacterium]|nr:hypothetical protein [Candidatus Dormibacteraeota bacterium]